MIKHHIMLFALMVAAVTVQCRAADAAATGFDPCLIAYPDDDHYVPAYPSDPPTAATARAKCEADNMTKASAEQAQRAAFDAAKCPADMKRIMRLSDAKLAKCLLLIGLTDDPIMAGTYQAAAELRQRDANDAACRRAAFCVQSETTVTIAPY